MIWCVEDDSTIRDIEVYTLCSIGFDARGFADGSSFWEALQQERPDLVVLDIMLPDIEGTVLLKKIRSSPEFGDLPVIMATARGAEYDKIHGLDLGADDYIVKPFGVMEMISRIKAVLRRYHPVKQENDLKNAGLVLCLEQHTLTVDGERIQLTYKEFELLRLFMEHPGVAFTRDQIFAKVWGVDYAGESRTVDMHIRTLRQKLGQYSYLIETVRHIGYRMEKQQ